MGLNIVTDTVWETIYHMLTTNVDTMSIIQYIHDTSIQFNMDKRTLLTSYFDYTIRNKPEIINTSYLKIVEDIIHIHDDIPMENVLIYFCECIADCMRKSSTIDYA